jgi:NDP-sugar pyrophosphorylase family protein
MKALILAAGFGTRLKPHTDKIPKSLFPIAGRPNLDIIIGRLIDAGCDTVFINTHHLHTEIEHYLSCQQYPVPVFARHETRILGTGGAIKNLARHWGNEPFLVINGDVVADIDFSHLYRFHLGHSHPATLVVCHDPEFNTVAVDEHNFIISFTPSGEDSAATDHRTVTFTGIQVVDPVICDYIPENRFSSSIDAFKSMLDQNLKLPTHTPDKFYWKDIGSPDRYRDAVFDRMAPAAFQIAYPGNSTALPIERERLHGDGSDRTWYRIKTAGQSLIMADHGIHRPQDMDNVSEIDSFVAIGRHLAKKNIPVPEIFLSDGFSGLVFLEDLGEISLQETVQKEKNPDRTLSLYKTVIDHLVNLSTYGGEGFDPLWTYQSAYYDKALILEKECRYFTEAFLNSFLGINVVFFELKEEWERLADATLEHAVMGFMHRDMQSKNIMVKNGQCFFIDFQGGRMGPFQYDLASLLIDPYVDLPDSARSHLLDYAVLKLCHTLPVSAKTVYSGYNCCAVTRNLQILGAFAFLSRQKKKTWFEQYIPAAVRTLRQSLTKPDIPMPRLKAIVETL